MYFGFIIIIFVFIIYRILLGDSGKDKKHTFYDDGALDDFHTHQDDAFQMSQQPASTNGDDSSLNHHTAQPHSSHDHSHTPDHSHGSHSDSGSDFGSHFHHDF